MEQNKDQSGAVVRGEAVADINFLCSTMGARVWATEFCKLNNASDHGMMLGWFANATMAGFDEANRRSARAADALDSQPTDSRRLTKAEREADLACETCHGTGQMCVGTSGQESDGNGPVMEPCAECGYGDAAPMVADPAGVEPEYEIFMTDSGSWGKATKEEYYAVKPIFRRNRTALAATVKAVPSEALDEAAAYRMWRDCEISEDEWFTQHLVDYLPAESVRRGVTSAEWDAAMARVMQDRAPLADKTGGAITKPGA